MKVHLSGKQFVFPRSCTCCGDYAITTLGAYGLEKNKRALTKAWAWDIPYCLPCSKHIQSFERTMISLFGGLVGALLSGLVVLVLTGRGIFALELSGALV